MAATRYTRRSRRALVAAAILVTLLNHARYSRRHLLKQLGVGAAMLPLIEAERAQAATPAGAPKRLVTITCTNGVIGDSFYPPGDALTFGETLKPLEPWRSKLLMPIGLDMQVLMDLGRGKDGHYSYPTLLTGTAEDVMGSRTGMGPSIDQVIADAIATKVKLPSPLLNLGVLSDYDGEPTSWRAAAEKNAPETDPARLFDRLFEGVNAPPEKIEQLRLRRKSVIDFVTQELLSFGRRLGTEDRRKIDAHLQSVRELEKRLQAPSSPPTCPAPATGAPSGEMDPPTRMKALFDLLAIALRCDLTRVATVDLYNDGGGGGYSFPWLGVERDYHAIAHAGMNAVDEKVTIDRWLFSNVAAFVKQLDETQEGGESLLDHSVVVVGNDMDDGANHSVAKIPFVLIGSCGGYFKTGRLVRFSGIPHNRLLATLCNAMDVPVTTFGAAGYEGTLPDLVV